MLESGSGQERISPPPIGTALPSEEGRDRAGVGGGCSYRHRLGFVLPEEGQDRAGTGEGMLGKNGGFVRRRR
ncbi:hypothetical protein L484_009049 [Morus notabilis]|uniref:Uncharacterized protein n=1 Tax=Morus notabilis TaxID=981085 RepID=W9RAZ7_9ROSA|nr:hypothetical protein L484_009049 [Morus notabilis]